VLGNHGRIVEAFALSPMWQTNCFILGDAELGTAVVVDPGQDGGPVVTDRLAARQLRCEALLLTHGHIDHIWAVPDLADDLDVPVLLHADDRWLWDNPAAGFGDVPLDMLEAQFGLRWDPPTHRLDAIRDGQTLSFAGMRFTVRHTPGHTPGSCVFLIDDVGEDDPVLLSGDLIFAGSVGRTDFPRGSWQQLLASIQQSVLPLEDRTLILPAHGPDTTVGRERTANPFLREIV
jgi:hydroxyacylglutathione hydrolase